MVSLLVTGQSREPPQSPQLHEFADDVAHQVLPANRSCAILTTLNPFKQLHPACTRAKELNATINSSCPTAPTSPNWRGIRWFYPPWRGKLSERGGGWGHRHPEWHKKRRGVRWVPNPTRGFLPGRVGFFPPAGRLCDLLLMRAIGECTTQPNSWTR